MEQVEVYINDQKVDLNPGVNIKETRQVNSLFDIKERRTSFTNKFDLPLTSTNKKILGFLGVNGNQSTSPYNLQNVRVVRNGIPTIENGLGYIGSSSNGKGYSLSIKDGNIGLFDAIGSKELSDLDFSSLNHSLTAATYEASLNNTANDGYIYPLINTGRWSSSTNIYYEYQIPCVFIKWLWDKIITEAGFTYSGSIFSDSDFINKAITVNTPPPTVLESLVSRLDVNSTGTFTDSNPDDLVFTGSDPNGILYDSSKKFKVKSDSAFKLSLDGSITVTTGQDLTILEVLINGVQEAFFPIEGSSMTVNHDFILNLRTDDEIQVKISEIDPFNSDPIDISYNIDSELFRDDGVPQVNFSGLFEDGISQKDFVKATIQYYGLVFDRVGSDYTFKTINELLDDRSNAQDWTHHFAGLTKDAYKVGRYAQSNKCTYSYEDNSPFLGDGELLVLDKQLEADSTLFNSPFKAASISQRIALSAGVYETPHWENKDNEFIPNNVSNYIFEIATVNGTLNFQRVTDQNSQSFTGDFPFADFTGMYWPLFLTTYYDNFRKVLDKARTVSIELRFTWYDMYSIDLMKMVYLSQLGSYFYINKVTKNKDKATAELVAIPDLS